MEEFRIKGNTYRIKKMNAIELLALRSQIAFDDYATSQKAYMEILSKVEVKVKDNWLPVRQEKNFYPAGIEDDVATIEKLITNVVKYLKEVFQKSNASSEETE